MNTNNEQKLYRNMAVFGSITMLSRVLGLIRDLLLAHIVGASAASDAWVQAFRIPNALRRFTADGSVLVALVPIYVKAREDDGERAASRIAASTLLFAFMVSSAIAAAGMIWNVELTKLISPGFIGTEAFDLTAYLLRWTFPFLVSASLVAWSMAVLNSNGYFAAPAAAPVILNICIISFLLFSSALEQPVLAMLYGVLAGSVFQLLLQLSSLKKARILPSLGQCLGDMLSFWKDPHLKSFLKLILPTLLNTFIYLANISLIGILASFLPQGQIFSLFNATRIIELCLGVFTIAFANSGLPQLSRLASKADHAEMRSNLAYLIAATSFIILPATAGLLALAFPISAMLYFHGQYSLEATQNTAWAIVCLAPGLLFISMVRLLTPALFTLNKPYLAVIASTCGLLTTLICGWLWYEEYQIAGLALATVSGALINAGLLIIAVGWCYKGMNWLPVKNIATYALYAAIMGGLVALVSFLGDWNSGPLLIINWIIFCVTLLSGVVFYLYLGHLTNNPHAQHWLRLLRSISRRLFYFVKI